MSPKKLSLATTLAPKGIALAAGSESKSGRLFTTIRRRLTSGTDEIVLACLSVLEDKMGRHVIPLGAVHSFVAELDPIASLFHFVAKPIPYSVELTNVLDALALSGKVDRFSIFDDGNHPQTVYRLTSVGRAMASAWISRLPPRAEHLASRLSEKMAREDVDREVRLMASLEEALPS